MTDTKFKMRIAQAGGFAEGAVGDVLTFQADGSVQGQPLPAPPAGGEPEGNIYWLDPNFVGTSNGSIVAPFTTFAEFWTVVLAGGANENFALMLPAPGVAIDAPMPNLGAGSKKIALVGKGKQLTRLGNLIVPAQGGTHSLYFYDCHFDSWTFASGAVDLFLDSVAVDAVTVTAALTGTLTAWDSDLTNGGFPFNAYDLVMYGGTLRGTAPAVATWHNGTFLGTAFTSFSPTSPGGVQHFRSCTFPGPSVNIFSNDHNPTLDFDPVSWQNALTAGLITTFIQLAFTPNMPRLAEVTNNDGVTINAGAEATLVFGVPNPHIEPGTPIVGSWSEDPGVGAVLQKLTAPGGSPTAVVANVSAAPITLPVPVKLTISYLTRSTP